MGTFEELDTKTKYDLSYTIHSLYYVDDLQKSLEKIITISDKAIIVHHGKRGINTIQEKFRAQVKSGPNIISEHTLITSLLDKMNVDYTFENYETKVNVKPCHTPDDKHGSNMIKFFLEKSELPQALLNEVSKYIREEIGDTMIHDMGLIIIK